MLTGALIGPAIVLATVAMRGRVGATAALAALGDNDPVLEDEYQRLGTTSGAYDDWHEGNDPAGITTQHPHLAQRLNPALGGRRLAEPAQVLRELLSHPRMLAYRREGLRERTLVRFNPAAMISRTTDAYERAIAAKKGCMEP